MLKTYALLTKPGIIFGNLIAMISGFMLASRGEFNYLLFLETTIALTLVIASACVFNNYSDRKSDQKMQRTKNRPLALGIIAEKNALIFGALLGFLGFTALIIFTNGLTVFVAGLGFFVYVILYDFWKYRSSSATLIGSIAGAVPPVVGYCAVSHEFDLAAALLFAILVLWQMPHFFSIAIYRLDDYQAASIPVLPARSGIIATKRQMLIYIVLFVAATALLSLFGFTGYFYLTVATMIGLVWLFFSMKGFNIVNDQIWARQMFKISLVAMMLLCLMISIDTNTK